MAYGTTLVDNIQSSTANTPVVFKDGNGTQVGTLCRAWVNFNGTGTVAIRASFNVSSITDNGTGDYTVNFTNAMPDANYAATCLAGTPGVAAGMPYGPASTAPTTTAYRLQVYQYNTASAVDTSYVQVSVFR